VETPIVRLRIESTIHPTAQAIILDFGCGAFPQSGALKPAADLLTQS
jgi:hypothetical protein